MTKYCEHCAKTIESPAEHEPPSFCPECGRKLQCAATEETLQQQNYDFTVMNMMFLQ